MEASSLISARLARFVQNTAHDDIPGSVLDRARYLMLDALGSAFASTHFEFAKRAMLGLCALGDAGSSVVIGMPGKLALRDAVLMNGILVHGLDFDDTFLPGSMHLTASAVPCGLGIGASTGASGRDVLVAVALAMEANARLAMAGKGGFQQNGFHPTSAVGIFGCTLLASRLWNMSVDQTILAQGIALSYASGTIQPVQDGSWTKRIHPGTAAASAITAASLGRQGYVGPRECYEGKFGLYAVGLGTYAANADLAMVTRNLGERWEFARSSIKLYPACHQTHAFVDAAIRMRREHRLEAEDIVAVKARVAKQAVALVCEPLAARQRPADTYAAQFSLSYQVARALLHGQLGLADFEGAVLKDPATLELARRLEYEIDPDSGFPKTRTGELVLTLRDGRQLRCREEIDPDDPVSEAQIRTKFLANAEFVMSPARAESLCDVILNLDEEADVTRFVDRLAMR